MAFQRFIRRLRHIAGFDRKLPSFAGDDGHAAHQPGDRSAVQRRRHDEQPQVIPQHLFRFETQRETEIGMQTPFMEFVKNDDAVPVQ